MELAQRLKAVLPVAVQTDLAPKVPIAGERVVQVRAIEGDVRQLAPGEPLLEVPGPSHAAQHLDEVLRRRRYCQGQRSRCAARGGGPQEITTSELITHHGCLLPVLVTA